MIIRKGNNVSGAEFSECGQFRFALWRTWQMDLGLNGRLCAFIGLNPSTADESVPDNTVTRCIRFAKGWGYDGYVMLNLFALRETDPELMMKHPAPVGLETDTQLLAWARRCALVVCAWGNDGVHRERDQSVVRLLRLNGVKLHYLGLTKHGCPKHPLYLSKSLQPQPWEAA